MGVSRMVIGKRKTKVLVWALRGAAWASPYAYMFPVTRVTRGGRQTKGLQKQENGEMEYGSSHF
jgi:hypothetical protein